jgi:oxygen-independent coproporphyrinogen III oxidase
MMTDEHRGAAADSREISLYVHVPYCHYKCRYCSFYSVHGSESDYDAFLQALAREWRLVREEERLDDPALRIASVYIGGGTPTVLGADRLKRLYDLLREGPAWLDACEVTLEANTESITRELIRDAQQTGYHRVSVGVQSFQDADLALLGRESTGDSVRAALRAVREAGCANLSLDLVYGLPKVELETWRASFREALDFRPEHISGYLLTPEEETLLHQLLRAGRMQSPLDEEAFKQYEELRIAAGEAGYEHYEIANFALPGFECRHHLDIWQRRSYYGLGPSAHSFDGAVRWCNAANLPGYLTQLGEAPRRPARDHYRLSPQDVVRETISLRLRQAPGLTWDELAQVVDEAAGARLRRRAHFLAGTGFMEVDDVGMRLAPQACFVASHVFDELIEAIERVGP